MATVALAVAASYATTAAVGTATIVGSLTAASAAYTVGSMIGGYIDAQLFAPQPPDVEGPKLENVSFASASEGAPVPRVYGTVRTACPLIWATKPREVAEVDKVGGKGIGGGQTVTEYEYYVSFAVLISDRPITSVDKFLVDGQEMDLTTAGAHVVYDGSQTAPDPTIAAVEGVAPAYKGMSYVVFNDVPLNQYGRRIPSISVEVTRSLSAPKVAGLIQQIADDTGLDVDVSAVPDRTVRGYKTSGLVSPRQALTGVLELHQLHAVLTDVGAWRITPSQGSPIAEIREDDLVSESGRSPLTYAKARGESAPAAILLGYPDVDMEHQAREARVARRLTRGGQTVRAQTALPATNEEALALAAAALESAALGRETLSGVLAPSQARGLRPGDFVTVRHRSGHGHVARIQRIATGWTGEFEAVVTGVSPGAPAISAPSLALDRGVVPPQSVNFTFLDLPLLIGGEIAHTPHVAAWGAGWRKAQLYRSPTGSGAWTPTSEIAFQATTGLLSAPLAPGPEYDLGEGVDPATLSVTLDRGLLRSRSVEELDNALNALAVESAPGSGEWEILQFETATPTGFNTYDLTGLRRARRGTDAWTNHVAGCRFVLLNEAVRQVDYAVGQRGAVAHWRWGPATLAYDAAEFQQLAAAFNGVGLRPFSPVSAAAAREVATNNVELTWVRRDRTPYDPALAAPPLTEASEAYEVDILDGAGAALRTLTSSAPSVVYAAADQIADGAVSPFDVAIYQMSEAVGRGTGRLFEVSV